MGNYSYYRHLSLKQIDDWIQSKWTHWQSSLKEKGSKNQDDIKLYGFAKGIQKENNKKKNSRRQLWDGKH